MENSQEVIFSESCLPLLQSGEYQLSAWEDGKKVGKSPQIIQKIEIKGPRFTLSEEEILGVSPGQGLNGKFGTILPQVMLNRKTLPWERSIKPSGLTTVRSDNKEKKENPWLYVFLLAGDEIVPIQTGRAEEVVQPSKDTFFPRLTLEESEKEQTVSYIDVDARIFRGIFPEKEELCYLSHARKTVEDTGNKKSVQKSEKTQEWYSVVMGNRLPQSSQQGMINHAYLVSVEGFDSWWDNDCSSYNKVRMILLYDWQFISVPERYHWKEMFADLDVGWLKMKKESDCSNDLNNLMSHGFVPLPHYIRDGSRTVSFYRGPLTPIRIKKEEHPVYDSDSLYCYDPQYGVFDVSLSCAWQHGRLLALANPSIVKLLQKNRSMNMKKVQKNAEKKIFCSHMSQTSMEESLEEQMLEQLNFLWEGKE